MSGRSRTYKTGLHSRLQDNAEVTNYLEAALADSEGAFLIALRNVLEARNFSDVAKRSGVDRVHLYRMLSENGNPQLRNLSRVLNALGLHFSIAGEEDRTEVHTVSASYSTTWGSPQSSTGRYRNWPRTRSANLGISTPTDYADEGQADVCEVNENCELVS